SEYSNDAADESGDPQIDRAACAAASRAVAAVDCGRSRSMVAGFAAIDRANADRTVRRFDSIAGPARRAACQMRAKLDRAARTALGAMANGALAERPPAARPAAGDGQAKRADDAGNSRGRRCRAARAGPE